jgi:hypothetical protein
MNPTPMMTPAEIEFLERHLRPEDRVWEWGSGASTFWLAERCRYVTAVEHQREFAAYLISKAPENVSVVYAPADLPYAEGTEDDGDLSTFRTYVRSYSGEGVDVCIVDGRARLECIRHVAETAYVGMHPGLRLFIHDAHRYERAWKNPADPKGLGYMKLLERCEDLALLGMRDD